MVTRHDVGEDVTLVALRRPTHPAHFDIFAPLMPPRAVVALSTLFFWWPVVTAFWGGATPAGPLTAVDVAPNNEMFANWPSGSNPGEYEGLPPTPTCNFWNASVYHDTTACNSFVVTRVSAQLYTAAMDRAQACALAHDTDCILSGEIGFAIPAAFIPASDATGFEMLIAPRIVYAADAVTTAASDRPIRSVRMQDPSLEHPNHVALFNYSIAVEYLNGHGARSVQTTVLSGAPAYCVQALRRAIVPSCWATLD